MKPYSGLMSNSRSIANQIRANFLFSYLLPMAAVPKTCSKLSRQELIFNVVGFSSFKFKNHMIMEEAVAVQSGLHPVTKPKKAA